jgi:cobaltochelatase CobT
MSAPSSPADQFKRLLSQTTKAIAANDEAEVSFGGDRPEVVGGRARLPTPPRRLDAARVAISRGHADAAALRLAHHDEALHARLSPTNEEGRAVFAALEDVRLAALGERALPGVGDNLAAALAHRLEDKGYRRMEDRQNVPIDDIVGLLVRERLTGRPVPESAEALVEAWRGAILDKGADALAELEAPAALGDQTRFAALARQLIEDLELGDVRPEEDGEEKAEQEETSAEDDQGPQDQDDSDTPPDAEDPDEPVPDFGEAPTGDADLSDVPQDWEAQDDRPEEDDRAPGLAAQHPNADHGERYHPYTTQYDEIASPSDLCEADELGRLRQSLDSQLESLHAVVARLANRLQRRLLAHQNRAWMFDLDEGMLDAARLARVVADPTQPLSFKMEKDQEFRDTIVTLLIDNSGSMRGRPITIAAICADILARTLERCAVKVEVLGFTTRAWKGGQSREKWVADGRPRDPGRLNDLRHIVYKPAAVAWRRARDNIGLMLKEGLLKENIDGEALLWAYERLMRRPEQRRILMVISDGAPVDDTTSSANGSGYLDRHLRDVIAFLEDATPIELIAIGIGHDVTRFYRRAVTIADADQLGGAMMEQLAQLFEEEAAPGRRRRKL